MAEAWKNWSGSVAAEPAERCRPQTEAELAEIVRRSRKLRVVGAGHSFMPLCETFGTLISLEQLEGDIELSANKTRAWCPAGWSLAKLTAALWEKGVSLINQGDVNPQALAGAIATGTHGTGLQLGSLSTAARAFRLMLADGSTLTCSPIERPDLFEAQRLSLGLLGVATRIEIEVLPAYHLEEKVESHPFEDVAARWEELVASNRHAEFFIFPYGENVALKMLNPVPGEGELKRLSDMDDRLFRMRQRRVGPAYQIFPSDRTVRFEEMEYEMPYGSGWAALREAISWIRKRELPVTFPFEFRAVAGDDIWMSPMNNGPCLSISVHQYTKMPWRDFFEGIEPIFRAHGGRPHWAKRHTLTAGDVDRLYPKASAFRAVRAEHDPGGKFANAHLAELFGVEGA